MNTKTLLIFLISLLLGAFTLLYGTLAKSFESRELTIALVTFTGSIFTVAALNIVGGLGNEKMHIINAIPLVVYFVIFLLQDNLIVSGVAISFYLVAAETMDRLREKKSGNGNSVWVMKFFVWLWFLAVGLSFKRVVK